MAGVIDAATRPAAASVLESIKTRTGLLCLDLEGLEACDPDGLRMLTGPTAPRATGACCCGACPPRSTRGSAPRA